MVHAKTEKPVHVQCLQMMPIIKNKEDISQLFGIIEHIGATRIKLFHYSHYSLEPISFDLLNFV